MGGVKVELLKKLREYAPVDRIVLLYEQKEDFLQELANYMSGGLVVSNPKFFMMTKPIDSSQPPKGQWQVDDPDCWYIRWVAGEESLGAMMECMEPLKFVMFSRITENGETSMRKYSWDRLARLTKGTRQ